MSTKPDHERSEPASNKAMTSPPVRGKKPSRRSPPIELIEQMLDWNRPF